MSVVSRLHLGYLLSLEGRTRGFHQDKRDDCPIPLPNWRVCPVCGRAFTHGEDYIPEVDTLLRTIDQLSLSPYWDKKFGYWGCDRRYRPGFILIGRSLRSDNPSNLHTESFIKDWFAETRKVLKMLIDPIEPWEENRFGLHISIS